MYKGKNVILTICARGDSKGVLGKNIKPLLGKPLIEYTINQAKSLPFVDRIIVSTDDLKIKKVAEKLGLEVPFLRPKQLASDKAAKVPAIIHAVKTAEEIYKQEFDVVIDLDPTSPLRSLKDIRSILDILVTTANTKSVFSVTDAYKNPYFNMVEMNKNKYVYISKKLRTKVVRRQDAPVVYEMNASIYAAWKNVLYKEKTFFTNQARVHVMPKERSVDIDIPVDFKFVELLMKEAK